MFNCQELAERGWTHLGVLRIIFDPMRYAVRPDRKVLKRWQGGLNILFVGRVAPNKRFGVSPFSTVWGDLFSTCSD
jgi:hypothetical protein